jgi:hypothetical protein
MTDTSYMRVLAGCKLQLCSSHVHRLHTWLSSTGNRLVVPATLAGRKCHASPRGRYRLHLCLLNSKAAGCSPPQAFCWVGNVRIAAPSLAALRTKVRYGGVLHATNKLWI